MFPNVIARFNLRFSPTRRLCLLVVFMRDDDLGRRLDRYSTAQMQHMLEYWTRTRLLHIISHSERLDAFWVLLLFQTLAASYGFSNNQSNVST